MPVEALARGRPSALLARADRSRRASRGDDAGLGGRTGLEREAVRLSYPTWLLEAFVDDYGAAEALALAEAMNQRAPLAVRVNTARDHARRR